MNMDLQVKVMFLWEIILFSSDTKSIKYCQYVISKILESYQFAKNEKFLNNSKIPNFNQLQPTTAINAIFDSYNAFIDTS